MTIRFTVLTIFITMLFSCSKDKARTCISCTQAQTPDFQVCEEPNGMASVNGQLTGVAYDEYLASLQTAGASCGN